jgi:hypothetical protein
VLGRPRVVHDRHVDGGDQRGDRAAMLLDRAQRGLHVEAVQRHQGRSGIGHHVELHFHPGDVEPRHDPQHHVGGREPEEGAHQLAVRGEVAVRELGALGGARRARGVLDEGGVVRYARLRRRQSARLRYDRAELLAARRAAGRGSRRLLAQGRRQRQARALGQIVAIRDPRHHLHRRARADGFHDVPPRVGGHEHPGARVLQLVLELDGLVHGVERNGDGPRLERAEVGDGELGTVLQVQGDPVARPDSAGAEPAREAIAGLVELGERDRAPVEHEGRLARGARRVAREEGGERLPGKPDARLVEAGRPVRLPDPVHGPVPDTTPHRGARGRVDTREHPR